MDEQTKKEIYEIIEQSKILEGLMKELECPLSEIQKNNLSAEEFFIDSTLCTAGCNGKLPGLHTSQAAI